MIYLFKVKIVYFLIKKGKSDPEIITDFCLNQLNVSPLIPTHDEKK